MRRIRRTLFVALIVAVVAGACRKVPDYVIAPDDMAGLMADIHIGEAMVDHNRRQYDSDSMRQVVKQSVFAKHGVTSEQFDTSMVWYGHNMKEYMDVYDKTVSILENRLAEIGNRVSAEQSLSLAGDSVDIWGGPRYLSLNALSASNVITFEISRDENWERGDAYTFRAKIINSKGNSRGAIAAEYDDGSVEFTNLASEGDGWKEMTFLCDSTRMPLQIYGFFTVLPEGNTSVYIDSVALVRNRLNPVRYNQRYRQRHVSFGREDGDDK